MSQALTHSTANPLHVALPPLTLGASVPARFHQVVAHAPDHIALLDGAQQITYAALDRWTDHIAAAVMARSANAALPVMILGRHSAASVAAMLGTLKAGRIYCPLDTALPPARMAHIRSDLGAGATLVERDTAHLASGNVIDVVDVDALNGDNTPPARLPTLQPSDLAAIYYTSGTTGPPKGILRDHAFILHRVWQDAQVHPFGAGDVTALLYSPAYSASMPDLFNALLNGGALALYRLTERGVAGLREWLEAERVTALHLHAGVLRQLLDTLPADFQFTHLRYVRPSDRTPASDVRRLQQHLHPDALIVHSLGSGETGQIARFIIQQDTIFAGDVTPVGYPVSTAQITLVDEAGEPVEGDMQGDVQGEIVVRSRYLSRGYWRQPELTAKLFRADPHDPLQRVYATGDLARRLADGTLVLAGRRDRRVKIRGYSVNLADVEAALHALPQVAQAVVTAPGDAGKARRIVAHVVVARHAICPAAMLREALAAQLPEYMLPARFVIMDALPMQPNGKVDMSALPPANRARPALKTPFVAPRNETEARIAALWANLLDVEEVGIEDNFFELGGDSLAAMRMFLDVEALVAPIAPHEYFQQPTIANLVANALRAQAASSPHPQPLPQGEGRTDDPTSRRASSPSLPTGNATEASVAARPTSRNASSPSLPAAMRGAVLRLLPHLSHETAVRALQWLGQPAVARQLFPKEASRLRDLMRELGADAATGDDALRASVMGNLLQFVYQCTMPWYKGVHEPMVALAGSPHRLWRSYAARVSQATPEARSRLYCLNGLEYLIHAQRQGHGVILLTFHTAASYLANLLMAHATGLNHVHTISLMRAGEAAGRTLTDLDDDEALENATAGWAAAYILEAHSILKRGGIVRFANDTSYAGGNAIAQQVGPRVYRLKPGFITLAEQTGAAVIPITSHCDAGGCLHVTVLPALRPPTAASADQRMYDWLARYAEFLATTWRATPAALGWGALHRYFRQPLADAVIEGKGKKA